MTADGFSSLAIKDVVIVNYPFEENETIIKTRPAIVIDKVDDELKILAVKITKTDVRDDFDYRIIEWVKASLRYPSTARASKIQYISMEDIKRRVGSLADSDYTKVIELVKEYFETLTK